MDSCMLCEEVKAKDWIDSPEWLYQEKYDGERALVSIKDYHIVSIITRRGLNVLNRYPEFKEITFKISEGLIDCEICVFEQGRSDFNLLSLRSHLKNEDTIAEREHIKVEMRAFDILRSEGLDMTMRGLEARQEYLRKSFEDNDRICFVKSFEKFSDLWGIVIEKELEGLIAKHKNSAYEFKRSKYWVKVKNWKEKVIQFDGYEVAVSEKYGWIKGITLTNPEGDRCACMGNKHLAVKERIDKGESVMVNCQYLEKTNGDRHRFISFKEVVENSAI